MPQQLDLLDDPSPDTQVWQQLTAQQRAAVIDTIARIIRKAIVPAVATPTLPSEKTDD